MIRTSTHYRQTPKHHSLNVVIWAALIACLPVGAHALGFRIPNQDAAAIARGNAFVATADNPSAIYYNPAGITQLEGHNVQIGVLSYMGINTHYEPAGGGDDSDTDFEVIPVPQIYYTFTPEKCPVSFGLGIYAPHGLGVQWDDDTGFRSIALESKLTYVTINPVIAWKPHRTFSISAGPLINYSEIKFNRGLASPTDFFQFKGDDWSFGFNVAALWQPHEKWSFGAHYKSANVMEYDGHSSYNPGITIPPADTKAKVDYPQIFSAGVSFRPTPKWNIEVDVDYTDWNTLNTVVLEGTSNLGFPFDLPLQLDWHESWFYHFGVTRYFENGWFASCGYFFSSETTSTSFYTPAVPDTALHVGSVGFGRKGEHWSWAVAAQIITGPERDVEGSQPNPFTGESADGSYQLFVPTLSFSVGYRF